MAFLQTFDYHLFDCQPRLFKQQTRMQAEKSYARRLQRDLYVDGEDPD